MKRTIGRMMLAMGLATSLLAAGTAASAKAGDIVRIGACSGASDWKLKLSPDNGRIELEFEVDQNKVGATWAVRIKQNGTRIFAGKRMTKAPSGSFTVRLLAQNHAGTDTFRASATNVATDESCLGRASIG
ncbi:MAG: hypothetical protein ACHQAW_04730 [Actinomycetota bacterium]|jgi:hypothetical protein